ncbi:MAG TPA: ABATE domain-containing protein, partial [Candidatus Dormibacteraeota bacterium]|nr:ABATE domain-containing protein [Candidatus Dormibacteraeota bacterium]
QFFGGRVCLDFANTVDWLTSASPQELIPDYATLLAWSRMRGTLPAAAVARLRACASSSTAAAAAARFTLRARSRVIAAAGSVPRMRLQASRVA